MRILLMNCDFDMDSDTNGAQIIKTQLRKAGIKDIEVKNVFDNEFPDDNEIKRYDKVIITGSRASVYEDKEWIKQLGDVVKKLDENNVSTLGICFGFQIVAEALGGKVEASGSFEEGFEDIQLTENGGAHPILSQFTKKFRVYQSHGDIVTKMPPRAVVLARNNHSLQAYAIGKFLCVQFHPEITPEIATKMAVRDGKDIVKILNGVKNDYKLASEVIDLFVKS